MHTLIEPFLTRENSPLASKTYLRFKRAPSEPFRDMSYAEFCRETRRVSATLRSLGVERGDRIALVSESRPEWLMLEFAALAAGVVLVPMFPTLTPQQIGFIVQNSGAKMLVVSNDLQLGKALKIADECKQLETILVFNDSTQHTKSVSARVIHLTSLMAASDERFDEEARKATLDDVALIIYTSGTTGNPKGVMLTHRNVQSNIDGALAMLPELTERDVALSFLPMCHAFEHVAMQFFFQKGFTVAMAYSIDTVADDLQEIRPTIMTGVPRFYERVYGRIMRMRKQLKPIQQHVFDWALRVGGECGLAFEGRAVPLRARMMKPLADRLVLHKVRARTGGRVRFFVSGAAALPAEVGRAFAAFGLPIVEGYGMTECSPVISVTPYNRIKWGAVGKAIPNHELRIADDGEILVRGPSVMHGYYNQPDATREMIDAEGWLHTGDVGHIDGEGYVHITDRKKHLFVSSGGKNIAPAPIENAIVQSRYIEQVMLIGDKRQYITALIVPDFVAIREDGLSIGDPLSLVDDDIIKSAIERELDEAQKEFANYERVRRFVLLPELFTVENGMMTPTLKIKRKAVEERYKELIESLYAPVRA
jgi:long-chain acyl-CoA synthetase